MRHALVLAVALACSGCELAENYLDPSGPRYSGNYADNAQPAAMADELRVVTFNIKFGEEYEAAAHELSSEPKLAAADVILLQEMDAPRTDAVARELAMNYVYYPGSVQDNGRDFGNAVLSRFPIVDDAKLILPHRNPMDGRIRIAVQATLSTPAGEVSAYSVHTETPWLGPRARLEQASAVRDHALASDRSVIAGGDFNTSDPGSLDETVGLFRSSGFEWASSDSGDTAGAFTLDHIFVRKLVAGANGSVSTQASDHRPEWALVGFASTP